MAPAKQIANESLLDKVAKVLEEVARQEATVPFEEAERRLDEMRILALKCATKSNAAWPIESELAVAAFMQSQRRGCDLVVCRKYFRLMCDLGFAHIAHKCRHAIIFAKYCEESGNRDEAIQVLQELKKEVEGFVHNGCWWPDAKQTVLEIESLLRGFT